MGAALGGEEAVGETAAHQEGGRQQSGLLSRCGFLDLELEPPPLGPARVHAQHHLGPVLGVGAARAGVDLGHRVVAVVLTGEQRTQLEHRETAIEVGHVSFDLGSQRLVALLLEKLVEGLGVGQAAFEPGGELEVLVDLPELASHVPGVVGVVPEVGLRHSLFELRPAQLEAVGAEDPSGLRHPLPQRGQRRGQVRSIRLGGSAGGVAPGHVSWRRDRA